MIISVAKTRNATKWDEKEVSFEELENRLKSPVVSTETLAKYLNLPKDKQDSLKDVGGFVGGRLRGGRRTKKAVINRSLVALDADNLNSEANLNRVMGALNNTNYNYVVHSTRKSSKQAPRIRIIIPLKAPVKPEWYEPIVRGLCYDFGIEFFDPTTVETNRLMYWPSVCSDTESEYFYEFKDDGAFLDGESYLAQRYDDWTNLNTWPSFPNEYETIRTATAEQEDPLTKAGPVGIFCRTYSISEAIDRFLSDVYREEENNRYTYIPGSTSNGAICYDDKFLYSFHATDPTSRTLCNAFDLIRIHKFGDTKKSVKDMIAFAMQDENVRKTAFEEDYNDFIEQIEKDAVEENVEVTQEEKDAFKNILEKLTKNSKGENECTIDNILLILNEDPNLKAFYNDIFSEWVVVTDKLPWTTDSIQDCPRGWTDNDDSGLRWYLEKYYGITGVQKMMDALNLSFQSRAVHPVREYFESLDWDGVKRIDTLLIDYFGADDNVYTREVMHKTLVAAVTRIYKPGTKFDNMPILVGSQGIGKSTFLATLGKDWFSDSLTEFSGKDAMELLNGNLIIEIGELNGFRKAEMDAIKQFLSKQVDEYRAAYARRKEAHKRQCVIFGTTNESTFLRDLTGNRRFWPIQCYPERITKNVWDDLPNEIDQIWAEAYVMFVVGENLRLSPAAENLARVEQEHRLEEDPRKGMIIEFIKQPIPEDWKKWDEDRRTCYWMEPDTYNGKTVQRTEISTIEIMTELFNIPKVRGDQRTSRDFNRILDSIEGLRKMKNPVYIGKAYSVTRAYTVGQEFYEHYEKR